jgi:hypothetical protein
MRETRKPYSEFTHLEKKKHRAVSLANRYQQIGKLKPRPCFNCGGFKNLEKHHKDYNKPLDVLWVCRQCHRDLHAGKIITPELRSLVRKWLINLTPTASGALALDADRRH